jgi:hypothetical protein
MDAKAHADRAAELSIEQFERFRDWIDRVPKATPMENFWNSKFEVSIAEQVMKHNVNYAIKAGHIPASRFE